MSPFTAILEVPGKGYEVEQVHARCVISAEQEAQKALNARLNPPQYQRYEVVAIYGSHAPILYLKSTT